MMKLEEEEKEEEGDFEGKIDGKKGSSLPSSSLFSSSSSSLSLSDFMRVTRGILIYFLGKGSSCLFKKLNLVPVMKSAVFFPCLLF